MLKNASPKPVRHFASCAAFAFLLWTLCSPVFLDTAVQFVDESHCKVKRASDQLSAELFRFANPVVR